MKFTLFHCFRCVTKLVIIVHKGQDDYLHRRIARCISEGLCEEDQDFLKQSLWKEQWKTVIQLTERKRKEANEVPRIDQSCTVQRAQTTGATGSSENVPAVQVHGSDQNEEIYCKWLDIMFVISAKNSIAKMKKHEWKTKNMMMILGDLIRPWNKIVGKVAEVRDKVSEKNRLEKCKGGNKTSKRSEVLQKVTDIEKKLLEKSEEEAKSKIAEEDQSSDVGNIEKKLLEKSEEESDCEIVEEDLPSDWDNTLEHFGYIGKKLLEKNRIKEKAKRKLAEENQTRDWKNIFKESGDILYSLEGVVKIGRARAIQLTTAARNKNKEAVLGEMEIVESEDDGEEIDRR
jgi:hypothetical protein